MNFLWLPLIRASIEMNRKNPAKAVDYLQTAAPYELSFLTEMYPAYLRGVAFLQLKQGSQAAAEFQKVFDQRGFVGFNQHGSLARLGMARAYSLEADTAKSRAAYDEFFSLWKDADPDVPLLKQAKAEYAKLP